eukprot:scaffold5988_cov381-Prasinococcus_capsulatus_cf.AAC.15
MFNGVVREAARAARAGAHPDAEVFHGRHAYRAASTAQRPRARAEPPDTAVRVASAGCGQRRLARPSGRSGPSYRNRPVVGRVLPRWRLVCRASAGRRRVPRPARHAGGKMVSALLTGLVWVSRLLQDTSPAGRTGSGAGSMSPANLPSQPRDKTSCSAPPGRRWEGADGRKVGWPDGCKEGCGEGRMAGRRERWATARHVPSR